MTTNDLIPIIQYFYSKTAEMEFCSSLEEIKYSLERYWTVTRGELKLLDNEILLSALSDLEYSIVGIKDGIFSFNLDSRTIEKASLVRKPRVFMNQMHLIKDFDQFLKGYGLALKDLIEGDETKQLYTNERGIYTVFDYDNNTFKAQVIDGEYMVNLLSPENGTK